MATKEQYVTAIARVRAGTASEGDYRRTERMSNNAGGGLPSAAREALRKAGRGK